MSERAPRSDVPKEHKPDSQVHSAAQPRITSNVPHAARIQRSFGRHSISAVAARVGGDAARDAHALAAAAFASGESVTFAQEPDLHTAAHELAHVVQQRYGLARGIDGGPDDALERHADQVADAVVRGQSAEPLLDRIAGHANPVVAIQRKTSRIAALEYANLHRAHIVSAIDDRIAQIQPPHPHPRLHWTSREEARRSLVAAISHHVETVPKHTLARLSELAYPADLVHIVELALRAPGGLGWVPQVGGAIAVAFDNVLLGSIERMGMRLRVQLDRNPELPKASTLVASSPLDGVVAEALVRRGTLLQTDLFHRTATHDDTPGKPFANGARDVTYQWQGSRDPKLWNWIKVTGPANVTVEDVARTPLGGREMVGSELAHRIVASPPFFEIPSDTARRVPDAWNHAPPAIKVAVDSGDVARIPTGAEIADSKLSDEVAVAQAPKTTHKAADRSLGIAWNQLNYLKGQLEMWVPGGLDQVMAFVHRHREVAGDNHRLASVFVAQTAMLSALADDVLLHARGSRSQPEEPCDRAERPGARGLRACRQRVASPRARPDRLRIRTTATRAAPDRSARTSAAADR